LKKLPEANFSRQDITCGLYYKSFTIVKYKRNDRERELGYIVLKKKEVGIESVHRHETSIEKQKDKHRARQTVR